MKIEEFIKNVKLLNIDISNEQLEKLEIYKNFLIEYNSHTNLTAIKSEEEIYLKHFYDSLTIAKVCNFNEIKSLLDIGSGAGFPGMVLKIFYPNINITLLDSNNKKATFLQELSKKLNLEVTVVNKRAEEYARNNLNKFDVVTSRAVANLRVLSEISLPLVKVNGLFIPLKGHIDDTLENSIDTIEIMHGEIINRVEFNLNNGFGERNIIVIKKLKETKIEDLRKYDKILKKPLKK